MKEKLESPILVTRSSLPPLEEYVDMLKPIWESAWLTNMGVYHEEFKTQLKKYLKASNLELFVNGHMALELAIQALELKGEVITTPFSFASTTHAIVRNGLKPVFCDINPENYTMDADLIESLITEKTSAILPVHVYGNLCDVERIQDIADRENQVLVRVNYTKENIGSIKDIADDLAVIPEHVRTFISVDLQQVWQDADSSAGEDLRKMVLDFCRDIDKSGIRCTSHYIRDLVRNSCYGDKRNYVLVNYDGYVYRCTARDFNEDNRAGVLHSDGRIEYYDNALEKRLAAKFSKTVCHTCRIAPLCAGGCCQQAVEHTDDECIYGYTSDDIDAIVADRFEYLFLK